ncbi:MAG: M20 family protein [Betaproteobacteria bacterium]|nr:MAG: M20 family protein [Betaproteobacteria bacterium]
MRNLLKDIVSESALVGWAQDFVRCPSPQTERFEAEPAVLTFIEKVVGRCLDDLRLPYRRDEMGNLIVEIGPPSDRGVMLMAYAMTHPAANMTTPYAGELIEVNGADAIRGRGISEQKGSLAAALAATYAMYRRGNLTGRLALTVSTAGETGRHDAARAILKAVETRPSAAVVVIGTTGRVSVGNKGRLDVLITVRGRAAHSSTPWKAVDAVAGARKVMDRLDTLDLRSRPHQGLGKATLAITSIRSFPDATHTIQSEVRLIYDRRLLPGDSPDEAVAQITTALENMDPWRVDVRPGPLMYPCEINMNGTMISSITNGLCDAGLEAPGLFHSNGSLDAGLFAKDGIEATMWGPGDMDQWHSDNEYIFISDLCRGADAYYAFLCDYIGR